MGEFKRVLVLPVGSYEFHGSILPSDTDSLIAKRVAADAVPEIRAGLGCEVRLLPCLEYGLSAEHQGLPNTGYVGHGTYYSFLLELFGSLAGPGALLVIVNAHGGNTHTLKALEADFNYTHNDRKVFAPSLYTGTIPDLCTELFGEYDAHAGSVESSLIAFYEGWPRRQLEVDLKTKLRGALRFFRTAIVAPNGHIKQLATLLIDPDRGGVLHKAVVERLSASVVNLAREIAQLLSD